MPHKAFSDAFADLEGFGNSQPKQREIPCRMLAGPPPFQGAENLSAPPSSRPFPVSPSAVVAENALDRAVCLQRG